MAHMETARTRVAEGGRIVIPAAYRKALGIKPGDEVVLQLDRTEIRVYSRMEALRRMQDRVCRVVPQGVSLVDELIGERREEAGRE